MASGQSDPPPSQQPSPPEEAAALINQQLQDRGLPGDAEAKDMVQLDISKPNAVILNDGNY